MGNDMNCVCVTTFRKNPALRVFIESYLKYGDLDNLAHFVICDDEFPTAQPVYDEFKDQFNGKLRYLGGPLEQKIRTKKGKIITTKLEKAERVGIARNKNRGIKFFLEETNDDHLYLFDDDIEFIDSGLEANVLEANWTHITGYLADYRDPMSMLGFFQQFPPFHETEHLYWCMGSQGVMLYFYRSAIERLGYMNHDWPGKYGYEHSVHSARLSRIEGFYPEYYAILKGCPYFFRTQQVANDYAAVPQENAAMFQALLDKVYTGYALKVHEPGV